MIQEQKKSDRKFLINLKGFIFVKLKFKLKQMLIKFKRIQTRLILPSYEIVFIFKLLLIRVLKYLLK